MTEENKPIKDLKDILAKVESEAEEAPPRKMASSSVQSSEEKISFVERTKIEKIFNQIQTSPSETIAPQEILSLLLEADNNAAQTPNSKILTDLLKQKKI